MPLSTQACRQEYAQQLPHDMFDMLASPTCAQDAGSYPNRSLITEAIFANVVQLAHALDSKAAHAPPEVIQCHVALGCPVQWGFVKPALSAQKAQGAKAKGNSI